MSIIEPYIILIILIITMTLFIWGRWRYDIVALIALMIAIALGAVPYDQAFSGLSNSAVITVACVMVISDTMTRSGILSNLMRIFAQFSKNVTSQVGVLSTVIAILSTFMNNVGALGLMMPITIKSALDSKRSPGLFLMPIALSSAMGGLITLIGTPPNLIVSSFRQKVTGHPFGMFDFAYVGTFVAIAGLIFIILFGWRLLPKAMRKKEYQRDDIFNMQDYVTEIKIPEGSPLIGKTVEEFENFLEKDFLLIGLIHNKRKSFTLRPSQSLKKNDILIVKANPDVLKELIQAGKLQLEHEKVSPDIFHSDYINTIEAVVPQGSRIEGRSSEAIRLRSRFQISLLAIARKGNPFQIRLNQVNMEAGDVVLLQGPAEILHENARSAGFLPLEEREVNISNKKFDLLPMLIFAVAIVIATFQLLPIQIAFSGAVLFMVLFKTIPVQRLYDSIDWSVIILLAAMIPIGNALQTTGGTALITHNFVLFSGYASPIWTLLFFLIITMTLSDFMNNAATAVVMAPIAISISQAIHVHADPFLMAVAVGASCSFLTPIGHQNNTLILGPGGYKFTDYIRLGLPLEILIIITAMPLILWAWPL